MKLSGKTKVSVNLEKLENAGPYDEQVAVRSAARVKASFSRRKI
jgi:hypothetical protein